MSNSKWIGPDVRMDVGDVGFLINYNNAFRGFDLYDVSETPAFTGQSNQPRLYGWCSCSNGTNTYASGMVVVERLAKNGRVLVRYLNGERLAEALEARGYPGLK